uniref:Syndecan n=1 Tax=Tetranychus urticae TaxID=32264 RepID=T1KC66_TETUR
MLARFTILILAMGLIKEAMSQGAYDPYQNYKGERKGSFTPGELTGIVVGGFAGFCALGVTVFFCYYVYKRENEQGSGGRYSPAAKLGTYR